MSSLIRFEDRGPGPTSKATNSSELISAGGKLLSTGFPFPPASTLADPRITPSSANDRRTGRENFDPNVGIFDFMSEFLLKIFQLLESRVGQIRGYARTKSNINDFSQLVALLIHIGDVGDADAQGNSGDVD
jgi:hypothetical protein